MVRDHEEAFFEALKKDLNKPEYETFGAEIAQLIGEIDFALKNLDTWARPQKVSAALVSFPSRHYVYPQPYGVAFIIGAWNYPILLLLAPVVGAIAAGNCAIIKPSEIAEHTARLVCRLVSEYFEPGFLKAVFGGPETSKEILNQKPDYIFFTGSPRVGKIIMKAAAETLTPVTLELGGKSPCIVDEGANIEITARRIVFGKLLSGGQTCVAPDYLLAHEKVKDELLAKMKAFITERYGNRRDEGRDLCKVVNKNNFERLVRYLKNGNLYHGGYTNEDALYIEPTLLIDVSWDDEVMQEEIFGPILPVISFSDFRETLTLLNEKERPLAAYYFGPDKKKQNEFIDTLQFGGGVINDTLFHFGNPELPVGGIGNSGLGRYHGKHTFDTFTHLKSIVKKPFFPDFNFRYPPFRNKMKLLRWVFKL